MHKPRGTLLLRDAWSRSKCKGWPDSSGQIKVGEARDQKARGQTRGVQGSPRLLLTRSVHVSTCRVPDDMLSLNLHTRYTDQLHGRCVHWCRVPFGRLPLFRGRRGVLESDS